MLLVGKPEILAENVTGMETRNTGRRCVTGRETRSTGRNVFTVRETRNTGRKYVSGMETRNTGRNVLLVGKPELLGEMCYW